MILRADWDQLDGLFHVMSARAVVTWGTDVAGTSKMLCLHDGALVAGLSWDGWASFSLCHLRAPSSCDLST